jgi:hypothetical protein
MGLSPPEKPFHALLGYYGVPALVFAYYSLTQDHIFRGKRQKILLKT